MCYSKFKEVIPTNNRIKELRLAIGLSQEEYGARIGVTNAAISRLESANRNITEQMLRAICREFGASYQWLTKGEGAMFEDEDNDASLHLMVDRIMASENEWVKQIFKGLGNLTSNDWKQINDILDKLLDGEKPLEDKITELSSDGQKNIAAARSGDRMEGDKVSKEEEDAVLPPPYTGDI